MIKSVKAIVGERIDTRGLRVTAMQGGLKKFRLEGAMKARGARNKGCRGTEGRSLLWHREIWIDGVCLV